MVVPLVIIHFNGILHYKPSILRYPQPYGNPHIVSSPMLVSRVARLDPTTFKCHPA